MSLTNVVAPWSILGDSVYEYTSFGKSRLSPDFGIPRNQSNIFQASESHQLTLKSCYVYNSAVSSASGLYMFPVGNRTDGPRHLSGKTSQALHLGLLIRNRRS